MPKRIMYVISELDREGWPKKTQRCNSKEEAIEEAKKHLETNEDEYYKGVTIEREVCRINI